MTEAPAPALDPRIGEYVQIWADSFSQVVGQVAGSPIPCVVRSEAPARVPPAELPPGDLALGDLAPGDLAPGDLAEPAGEDGLWALVTSSGALRGEMSLRLSSPTVLRLAQTFMSEPLAPEAALTQDHREAVEELLRQISGFVATAAKPRWGELQLHVELAAGGDAVAAGGSRSSRSQRDGEWDGAGIPLQRCARGRVAGGKSRSGHRFFCFGSGSGCSRRSRAGRGRT